LFIVCLVGLIIYCSSIHVLCDHCGITVTMKLFLSYLNSLFSRTSCLCGHQKGRTTSGF